MRLIRTLSLGFSLCLVSFSACTHMPPNLRGELWAGSSKEGGIARAQDRQVIPASDPKFDQYVCQKYESLKALIQSCKEWY